ncbi:hypothetical protein [Chryseobacterium sp.]|uniref:hypothetical protein n=1 Tax=Chryseobacterium sp. TaxID=1871047 RepID=UPI0025BD59C1|nr:hypothetical protein [Chryseobacterium sp.]
MKRLIAISFLSVLLMNCNKKAETKTPVTTIDSTDITTEAVVDTLGPQSFCYMGVTGKDSIFASIDDNLGTITGKMAYKNSEKDSSRGDLLGFKSGDTLKLTYEFESEGTKSKRDIFFIQKDNSLIEGIGDSKPDETGAVKYNNEKKIDYKGPKLEAADCKVVTEALK